MYKKNFGENEIRLKTRRDVNFIWLEECNSRPHEVYPFIWQNLRTLKIPSIEEQVDQEDLFFSSFLENSFVLSDKVEHLNSLWLSISFLYMGSLAYVYLGACIRMPIVILAVIGKKLK